MNRADDDSWLVDGWALLIWILASAWLASGEPGIQLQAAVEALTPRIAAETVRIF